MAVGITSTRTEPARLWVQRAGAPTVAAVREVLLRRDRPTTVPVALPGARPGVYRVGVRVAGATATVNVRLI